MVPRLLSAKLTHQKPTPTPAAAWARYQLARALHQATAAVSYQLHGCARPRTHSWQRSLKQHWLCRVGPRWQAGCTV